MDKKDIKAKLRESIHDLFVDEEKKPKPKLRKFGKHIDKEKQKDNDDPKNNNLSKEQGQGGKKDYTDVRRAFEKLGGPSMVDVMKLCGIPDDEKGVNRSLFRKKVKQIKNKDTGSYYQFSDEELNQVRSALDIKK